MVTSWPACSVIVSPVSLVTVSLIVRLSASVPLSVARSVTLSVELTGPLVLMLPSMFTTVASVPSLSIPAMSRAPVFWILTTPAVLAVTVRVPTPVSMASATVPMPAALSTVRLAPTTFLSE